MNRIIVSISGTKGAGPYGGHTDVVFDFDWATHGFEIDENNRLLRIDKGFSTALIVPLEHLNYLRVVDLPEEEEPDETH